MWEFGIIPGDGSDLFIIETLDVLDALLGLSFMVGWMISVLGFWKI